MFNVDSCSTGEPPTPRSDSVLRPSEFSSRAQSVINPSSDFTAHSQIVPTVLQEFDSGYEASPSSTGGNTSFNFDRVHADTEVYDDSVMTFHMDDLSQLGVDERSDRLEMTRSSCPRCGTLCFCFYGMNSVSNNSDVSLINDESRNYRGNELSGGRSSSLPIVIPRSSFTGYLPLCSSMTRSHPLTYGQPTSEQPLPMSWPSVAVLGGARRGRWLHISRPFWEDIDAAGSRARRAAPTRDRRRLIDSDASSLSSSEGDGPEDVFDAEEDSLQTLSANAFGLPTVSSRAAGQETLPDLVQAQSSRRNRSVSVNLPINRVLADTIVDVGRSLRRLSDEFSRQRQNARSGAGSRRFTVGDFVNYSSSVSNSNNHDDSDDFSSVVYEHPST